MKPESNPEIRKQGMGGSDAGVVYGCNPWKTAFELWQEKTGRKLQANLDDKEAVQWGVHLEEPIAQEYARRTGNKVRNVNRTLKAKEYPFLQGHIDRKISGENAGLEVKTAGFWSGTQWGDDIPAHYKMQVYHYLYVTGYDYFDVAALIGGQEMKIYRIERDEDEIKKLVQAEVIFWQNHVLTDIPPEPASPEESLLMYPVADDEVQELQADPMLSQLIAAGKDLQRKRDMAEEGFKLVKKDVMNHMKSASVVVDMTGHKIASWINGRRQGLDTKSLKQEQPELWEKYPAVSEYRTFRLW
jgi:putative phage-type endonuclease